MRRYHYASGKQLSGQYAFLVGKRVTWEASADTIEWYPAESIIGVVNWKDPRCLCLKNPTFWIDSDGLRTRNIVIHGLSTEEAATLREQLQQTQDRTKYGEISFHTAEVCQAVCAHDGVKYAPGGDYGYYLEMKGESA